MASARGKRIATIGVYGFDLDGFLDALRGAGVDTVVDVRQRRGVRGSQYAWANAKRLEASLEGAGLDYRHMPELAPTTSMREAQYREDARRGEGKRSRSRIADAFADRYVAEILDRADLAPLLALLDAGLPALLCVETSAAACHRSLVAGRLKSDHGAKVIDLEP